MTNRSCVLAIDRFKPGDFMTVGMNAKRAAWFCRIWAELCIRRSLCALNPLHPLQHIKGLTMAKMTKAQLIDAVSESSAVSKNDVKAVMEHLATVGYKELNESGEFVIPGFVKMSVVNKPATEARSGINPFTKEPMEFAAKPASKTVKASPLKVAKDAV